MKPLHSRKLEIGELINDQMGLISALIFQAGRSRMTNTPLVAIKKNFPELQGISAPVKKCQNKIDFY